MREKTSVADLPSLLLEALGLCLVELECTRGPALVDQLLGVVVEPHVASRTADPVVVQAVDRLAFDDLARLGLLEVTHI